MSTNGSGPRGGRRHGTALAALAAALLLAPAAARGQGTPWEYDQVVNVSYEFDDNVNEFAGEPVTAGSDLLDGGPARAQVAKLAYLGRGDLQWSGGDQRLTIVYHGGFKRHFGVVRDAEVGDVELDLSSQFVNEASLTYLRRVVPNVFVSGRAGMKDRRWTDGDFFFINEDAFRRYSASAATIVNLSPMDGDHPARLEVGARYGDIRFENLDQAFGNHSIGAHALLTKEYGPDLEVTWSYSYDRVRFPGRGVYTPNDTDPTNILRGVTRPRQEDQLHELGTEVQWFGQIGLVAEYQFRYNDSNSFGFSYFSHNFGLQVLRRLPWEMTAHAYGRVELRSFTEPVPSLTGAGSLDIGEAEDNVLLFRLVKDITPNYQVEARYARYRNESITQDDFYTKNIYAVGMTVRP